MIRNSSPLGGDEVKMDLMLVNMKNNMMPLISTIILPKVLTLCYVVQIETYAMVYLQFKCGTNMSKRKISWDVSAIQHHGCNVGQQAC